MADTAADYTALPQRPPRERRSSKRAKADGEFEENAEGDGPTLPAAIAATPPPAAEEATAPASSGGTAAVEAAGAGAGSQQGQRKQQGEEQPEVEGAGGAADAAPAAAQLDLPAYRSAAVRDHKFEYLDHTADVQLHAWGETLREAFENVALCMFNYMTPLKGIEVDPSATRRYEAVGHDLQSLLYNFLDEMLFAFSTEFFVPKHLRITRFDRADEAGGAAGAAGDGAAGSQEGWRIEAEGEGERFDRERHVSGTEVKAITYSAMQINETPGDAEVFVIVDI